jgi:hypothetical protein
LDRTRLPRHDPTAAVDEQFLATAEAVRAACLDAARQAHEDAGMSGLCAEGRYEAALSAIAALDLSGLLGASAGAGPAASPNPTAARKPHAEPG